LISSRLDKESAETILRALRDANAGSDTSEARSFIFKRSAQAVLGQLLGIGSNVFALWATINFLTVTSSFSNPVLRTGGGSIFGFLSVLFALELGGRVTSLLATIIASTLAEADTGAFLALLRERAGERQVQTGLQEGVDSIQVLRELQALSNELRSSLDEAEIGTAPKSELDALNAYFKQTKAQKLAASVDCDAFGLSQAEVQRAADAFSQFDVDDAQQLDARELSKVLDRFAPEMDDSKKNAAFRVLDQDGDRKISFSEFILFWSGRLTAEQEQQQKERVDS